MKKTFLILLLGSVLSLSAQSTGQFSNGKTYNISGKELSTKTAMPDDSIDEEDFEKQYARVENENKPAGIRLPKSSLVAPKNIVHNEPTIAKVADFPFEE